MISSIKFINLIVVHCKPYKELYQPYMNANATTHRTVLPVTIGVNITPNITHRSTEFTEGNE